MKSRAAILLLWCFSNLRGHVVCSYLFTSPHGWPPPAACTKWASPLMRSPAVLLVEHLTRVIGDALLLLLLHSYEILPAFQSINILMRLLFCSRSFTTGVWSCPDIPGLFLDAASGPPALIGTFIAEHCFLMIFSAAPCLLWNRKCCTWRSPSCSLRGIALQLTAFPVQSKSFWNRKRCSGSHFCDEARADFTQLLCDSCSSMSDTIHS